LATIGCQKPALFARETDREIFAMERKQHRLTARKIASLKKPGRYSDGGNLYLCVGKGGARSWVFLYRHNGRTHEMGLGSAAVVTLAMARKKARAARVWLVDGGDPLDDRRATQRAAHSKTFEEVARELIASKESAWRSAKHRAQWRTSLEQHAAPLMSMPVQQIGLEDVLSALKPIWQTKAETASRLRGRIEAVLDYAKVRGWREGENPARWRGHLSHLLPRRAKLSRGHLPAMPYADVPTFMAALRKCEGIAPLALEFAILTAARTNEVLGCRWNEIDLEKKIWTLPPQRMKSGRSHRVPLSGRAMEIIETMSQAKIGEYVFPGNGGGPLSATAMLAVIRRMGCRNATVHGFRSCFRDFAGNETTFARELCEAALAHAVGDSTEAAYRRSDGLEKRRALMQAWAAFCGEPAGANVIPLLRG
jgi:integrase